MLNLDNTMKKQSSTLLALILSTAFTYAQGLKPNTTVKANKATFRINEVKMHGAPSDYLSVVNSTNIYYGKLPKNRNPDMSFPFTNKSGLLNAITQTFSEERLKQLLPERRILITFYVDPHGKVAGVSFLVNKNTLLTATELENLENAIKADVSFKIRPEDAKGHDFFDVGYPVIYERVLNGTL
jgi:hypothetical protein